MFDRKGQRKYLNAPEREAFLKAVEDEKDERKKAFCLTLFHSGCRISEGLNVTVERIDLGEKTVVFETLKRRKEKCFRAVPMPDATLQLLGRIMAGAPPADPLWSYSRATAYRLVKDIMTRAGISGSMACPKGLRHGFGIACIESRVPLTTVKKWMGHARLENTAIYLEAGGNEERKLAERLWNPKQND